MFLCIFLWHFVETIVRKLRNNRAQAKNTVPHSANDAFSLGVLAIFCFTSSHVHTKMCVQKMLIKYIYYIIYYYIMAEK